MHMLNFILIRNEAIKKFLNIIVCILCMCGAICSRIIFEFKYYFLDFIFRILGLCLLQNELCPITLNRHVIKVLLGRKVSDFNEPKCFYNCKIFLNKITIYTSILFMALT